VKNGKREERRGEGKKGKGRVDRYVRVQLRRSHLPSTLDSTTSSQPGHQLSDFRGEASQERVFLTFDQIILPLVRSLTVTTSLPSVELLLSSSGTITSQPEEVGRR